MNFNEDARVKIPAVVHLTRLNYNYVSFRDAEKFFDAETNIYKKSFRTALNAINATALTEREIERIIGNLKDLLDAADLGRNFYEKFFTGTAFEDEPLRLIDFDAPDKNIFEVMTEVPYRSGADSFRPDITIFVNGLPLAFVEVKIPDNKRGIQAEHDRMTERFSREQYKHFANITQLMIFSNNAEYDDAELVPLNGAFYAASDYEKIFFNRFREEDAAIYTRLAPTDDAAETKILRDTNYLTIRETNEYETNKNPLTPTNRILTSLLSRERFIFILRYGLAYVQTRKGDVNIIRKHVVRYQQLFAMLAIKNFLDGGAIRGVIWHTQGSGKTALAFHCVKFLSDYFRRKNFATQFYFIVDRLDLLKQAADEFEQRGLAVNEIASKKFLAEAIERVGSLGNTGKPEITVVNIQKFSDESVAALPKFNVNVQRIYFIDEAHRDYKWDGSFLARLMNSDRAAVMIALTGTPLIGEFKTREIFGKYIHKYFYNRSIADGYTLRLIREGIKTEYRLKIQAALSCLQAQVARGTLDKNKIYSHENYIAPLVEYIEDDFAQSRLRLGEPSIGAMIVCDSSAQAQAVCAKLKANGRLSVELILSTTDDTDAELETKRKNFKAGIVDVLVVYKMLLTGFDAPRLKKIYLGRIIREHNLLQALTRVNRPYKNLRYGYVVDFADIREEFDKTNRAYLDELRSETGDDFSDYQKIFKTREEISADLNFVRDVLFQFDTDNAEIFSEQIHAVNDKTILLGLRRAIELYKECYNLAAQYGYDDLRGRFSVDKIFSLSKVINNRLQMLNFKDALNDLDTSIVEVALDEIEFTFRKISEHELGIKDDFLQILSTTRREFNLNADKKDPEYVALAAELKRVLNRHNIEEMTAAQMQDAQAALDALRKKIHDLNALNDRLSAKYIGDKKFMRIHKRLADQFASPTALHELLSAIKFSVDDKLSSNYSVLNNAAYFKREVGGAILRAMKNLSIPVTAERVRKLAEIIAQEYFDERSDET